MCIMVCASVQNENYSKYFKLQANMIELANQLWSVNVTILC
jgi:hypothetical protein